MNIGEVHARLREDFPSLELSKLRYFEAMDLVEPVRTPAGYRKYSAHDIERLRYALQPAARPPPAAEGHPRAPRRARPWARAAAAAARPAGAAAGAGRRTASRRRAASTPTPPGCGSPGVSCWPPRRSPRSSSPSSRASGSSSHGRAPRRTTTTRSSSPAPSPSSREFGIEPRHLRAFKTAADREVGLVEQVVVTDPAQPRGRAPRVAPRRSITQIAALSVRLHAIAGEGRVCAASADPRGASPARE